MASFRHCIAALAFVLIASPVLAGGSSFKDTRYGYCRFAEDAAELVGTEDVQVLYSEVERRYVHAAQVSKDESTIYSATPLFLWSNEAKIACAKAMGYLKWKWKPRGRERHFEMLQKCECFYSRMTMYLPKS